MFNHHLQVLYMYLYIHFFEYQYLTAKKENQEN